MNEIRENIVNTAHGYSVSLYGNHARLGYAAVSVMSLDLLTANLDYVFVRHEENHKKGYGRLLMAHWLVEAESRGCEIATADFIDFRALRAFKHTVNGVMPTRMVCSEAIDGYQGFTPDTYEHAESLLNTETLEGHMLCGGISCDVDLRDPTFTTAAKLLIANQIASPR